MNVLQVNKFFYIRGGSERVFFDTIKGLRARGVTVREFSMEDQRNFPSDDTRYFIHRLPELKNVGRWSNRWRIFKHLFYSKEVVQNLAALVRDAKPDIAHLHNVYHQLSASTFTTLRKLGVPMVMTLHDVFPLCPNHSLLKGETMGEEYFKNKLYNCIRYKCIDNKFLPSLAGTLEAYYYRYAHIWDSIKLFICPSVFMKHKMVEYGFPESKMRVLPNPYVLPAQTMPLGSKIVYLGRIHYEKGIKIFMRALTELKEFSAIVAGIGPDEHWVSDFIQEHSLTNVERRGWVYGESWNEVMAAAKILVMPSVFYENCSLAILEALANGRIVVTVDRGGNPEIIKDGITGFLAKPEDPDDLARVIRRAMSINPTEVEVMIKRGREMIRENHNPDDYFKRLMEIYQEAIL